MPDYYYRYCKKCKNKIVGHAFSEGECTICKEDISCSHTPCDPVCRDCSIKENVCMSCGTDLIDFVDPVEPIEDKECIETVEELTTEEVISKYGTEQLLQALSTSSLCTQTNISEYIDHIVEDKQRLEGLILHFRQNLKSRRDAHFMQKNGVAATLTAVMSDYDKHFNITTKRKGEIEK